MAEDKQETADIRQAIYEVKGVCGYLALALMQLKDVVPRDNLARYQKAIDNAMSGLGRADEKLGTKGEHK